MASSLPALSSTLPPLSLSLSYVYLFRVRPERSPTWTFSVSPSRFNWIHCRGLFSINSCVLDKAAGLPKRVPTGIEIEFFLKKKHVTPARRFA